MLMVQKPRYIEIFLMLGEIWRGFFCRCLNRRVRSSSNQWYSFLSLSLSGTVKNWSLRIYQFLLTRTWNNWSDVGILHSNFRFFSSNLLCLKKILGWFWDPLWNFFDMNCFRRSRGKFLEEWISIGIIR